MPIAAALLTLAVVGARLDSWNAMPPRVFASLQGGFGLKVLPFGGFKDNPKATLFRIDKAGQVVIVWSTKMASQPVTVCVSDAGHVATVDQWGRTGYDHAVVLYGKGGKLLADFKLKDLFTQDETIRNKVVMSISSYHWADRATLAFEQQWKYRTVHDKTGIVSYGTPTGWQFTITTNWGGILKFDADSGKLLSKFAPKGNA